MNQEIIFEDCDTLKETAIKTVLLWCGTSELKTQMLKLGINYSKVERKNKVFFVLRHKDFGRIEVKL